MTDEQTKPLVPKLSLTRPEPSQCPSALNLLFVEMLRKVIKIYLAVQGPFPARIVDHDGDELDVVVTEWRKGLFGTTDHRGYGGWGDIIQFHILGESAK